MKRGMAKIDRRQISDDLLECKKAVLADAVKEARKRGKYKAKSCLLDEFAKKLFSFQRLTSGRFKVELVQAKSFDPDALLKAVSYNVVVNGFSCRVSSLQGAIDFLHGVDFALALVDERLILGNGDVMAFPKPQKMIG